MSPTPVQVDPGRSPDGPWNATSGAPRDQYPADPAAQLAEAEREAAQRAIVDQLTTAAYRADALTAEIEQLDALQRELATHSSGYQRCPTTAPPPPHAGPHLA